MTRMDEQIKQDVVDELTWDDRVDASRVSVEVDDGTVALRGEVPTYLARTASSDDAVGILGVVDVRNQLAVRCPAGTLPRDEELEAELRARLARNPDIRAVDMEIGVRAGVVTLRGTVDAYWKKLHSEDLVSSEPGVTSIDNHLAITPGRDVADKEIAYNIVRSLEARSSVRAENVNVQAQNGLVTLTGTVQSRSAHRAAHDAAAFTAGVTGVDNRLLVSGDGAAV